jgi:hypothetical protein
MLAFNIINDLFIQYSPSVEVSTTKRKGKSKKESIKHTSRMCICRLAADTASFSNWALQ